MKLFTPYAQLIDVVETTELVPGNLVFDDWDQGDFELANVKEWDGGRTLRYERRS